MNIYSSPRDYVRQVGSSRRSIIVWSFLTITSVLIFVLIIGAPIAIATGYPFLGLTAYQVFSSLCHQIPERSFMIAGSKFAVCSRCTGLYAAFAVALLLYPVFRSLKRTDTPSRKWLLLAAVPLLIDFCLKLFGVWENTHWSRFFTGALLGSVAVFYVMPGLVELANRGMKGRKKSTTSSWPDVSSIPPEHLATAPSDYSAPHRRI